MFVPTKPLVMSFLANSDSSSWYLLSELIWLEMLFLLFFMSKHSFGFWISSIFLSLITMCKDLRWFVIFDLLNSFSWFAESICPRFGNFCSSRCPVWELLVIFCNNYFLSKLCEPIGWRGRLGNKKRLFMFTVDGDVVYCVYLPFNTIFRFLSPPKSNWSDSFLFWTVKSLAIGSAFYLSP